MEKVIFYTKPGCVQCYYTKKYMDVMGIQYEEKDVLASEEAWEEVNEMGFWKVPVVKCEQRPPFGGFQPDKLDEIVQSNDYSYNYYESEAWLTN